LHQPKRMLAELRGELIRRVCDNCPAIGWHLMAGKEIAAIRLVGQLLSEARARPQEL
jgi:hypothetical protein